MPSRMPEVYQAPFGSAGTELRLVTTPASSSADSACRPVRPNDETSSSTMWLSVPPVTSLAPRGQEALGQRLGVVGDRSGRRSGTTAAGPRRARRPWRPSRARAGRRAPSGSRGRRRRRTPPCASTRPPRGPRSDLWVVVVVTWACGTGSSSPVNTLPATRPAKCAMSTISVGADLVGDLAHLGEVHPARVRRVAGDQHQRLELAGLGARPRRSRAARSRGRCRTAAGGTSCR